MKKQIPNPDSQLLANAVIGGAGLGLPPVADAPEGMATVVLYVPVTEIVGKTMPEIQADLGLPWHIAGGGQYWFNK